MPLIPERAGLVVLLIAILPAVASAQLSEAERLIEAGHWKRARAVVETRLRLSPNDPLCNYLLSQIHHAFGDDASPRRLAEKALTLDSRVAKYHRQLAEVLGVQAQHAGPVQLIFLARQFLSELDTAIALDPHDIQAQRDLLEYYLVAPGIVGGDLQKASVTADRIAVLDAAEGFLARARIATVRKQTSQVVVWLRKAADAEPPSYRAHVELARYCLSQARRPPSAASTDVETRSAPPLSASPLRACFSGENADPAVAELAAKEARKLDPNRVESWAVLAEVYAGRGDWTALDAILTEASQHSPDDLAPYYRAADALLGNGLDPVRAVRYLRVYLAQEPEGNEPTLADARRKLDLAMQARTRKILATTGQKESQ